MFNKSLLIENLPQIHQIKLNLRSPNNKKKKNSLKIKKTKQSIKKIIKYFDKKINNVFKTSKKINCILLSLIISV